MYIRKTNGKKQAAIEMNMVFTEVLVTGSNSIAGVQVTLHVTFNLLTVHWAVYIETNGCIIRFSEDLFHSLSQFLSPWWLEICGLSDPVVIVVLVLQIASSLLL